MREFEELVGSLEFEERGSLRLTSATWADPACELLLDLCVNESTSHQAWLVRCGAVRAYRLVSEWLDRAHLFGEHALLIPYTEPRVQLAFLRRPSNADAVVGQLWEAHRRLLGQWVPFDEYLNPGMSPSDLLASGGGCLADGPRSLMQAYAGVLDLHGVEPSFLAERPAVRWLDEAWQPELRDLQVFVMGESYPIGTAFQARKESPERLVAGA